MFLTFSGWPEHLRINSSQIWPKIVPIVKYYEKWPVLRVLWIAYKKGNESGVQFSQLPWPLMVQLLRWIGEVNHIPKLYKNSDVS